MGCRRGRGGSTATFAAIDRYGKAETDSQFALMGTSTESVSFQNWVPINTGAPSASRLGGISPQRSYGQTRKPGAIASLNPIHRVSSPASRRAKTSVHGSRGQPKLECLWPSGAYDRNRTQTGSHRREPAVTTRHRCLIFGRWCPEKGRALQVNRCPILEKTTRTVWHES
jgi:hypothetical protein